MPINQLVIACVMVVNIYSNLFLARFLCNHTEKSQANRNLFDRRRTRKAVQCKRYRLSRGYIRILLNQFIINLQTVTAVVLQ